MSSISIRKYLMLPRIKRGQWKKVNTFNVQKTIQELQLIRAYRICYKYRAAPNLNWSFIYDAPDHPATKRHTISETSKSRDTQHLKSRKTSHAYKNIVKARRTIKYPSLNNLTFFSQESWLNISVTSTKCLAPIYLITDQCKLAANIRIKMRNLKPDWKKVRNILTIQFIP